MQTLLVEIKKHAGLKILQELEQADLIRLIPSEKDDKPQKIKDFDKIDQLKLVNPYDYK